MANFISRFAGYLLGNTNIRTGWFQSRSQLIGQSGYVWIDTQKPRQVYDQIPQIEVVVNRFAKMFSNAELLIKDSEGNIVEDIDLKNILFKPNPIQGLNEFLEDYCKQLNVYGNAFIYKNKFSRLTKYPNQLICISPYYIEPELTGKLYKQTDVKDIIKRYKANLQGGVEYYDVADMLWNRISDLDNPIMGRSPLLSLKYPISNIDAAYKYQNSVYANKGAIGMISQESPKDSMGALPMTQEQKLAIEEEYRRSYGVEDSQNKILFTSMSAKYTPMSYPIDQMKLPESIDANFNTIADKYGMNTNLFANKNSTFENVKNGIIQTYQDTIIPFADNFCQKLSGFILPKDSNLKIVASYEHVPILKDQNKISSQSFSQMVSALNDAVASGLISQSDAQLIITNELNSKQIS